VPQSVRVAQAAIDARARQLEPEASRIHLG
jgi:hypothetical protein